MLNSLLGDRNQRKPLRLRCPSCGFVGAVDQMQESAVRRAITIGGGLMMEERDPSPASVMARPISVEVLDDGLCADDDITGFDDVYDDDRWSLQDVTAALSKLTVQCSMLPGLARMILGDDVAITRNGLAGLLSPQDVRDLQASMTEAFIITPAPSKTDPNGPRLTEFGRWFLELFRQC